MIRVSLSNLGLASFKILYLIILGLMSTLWPLYSCSLFGNIDLNRFEAFFVLVGKIIIP